MKNFCNHCHNSRCDCSACFGIPSTREQLDRLRRTLDILTEGKYFIDTLMHVGNAIDNIKRAKETAKDRLYRQLKRKEKYICEQCFTVY